MLLMIDVITETKSWKQFLMQVMLPFIYFDLP